MTEQVEMFDTAQLGHNKGPKLDGPLELGPCAYDFEQMPALVRGRCNACGGLLTGRQVKVCSDECARWWQTELTLLGRKLAERQLIVDMAGNKKNRPKTRARAFSEIGRLSREWLRRHREALEARIKEREANG